MAFAHSRADLPRDQWHRLRDHLSSVAAIAARFASLWNGEALAHYAGLWHDLGKYSPAWQDYLHQTGEEASVLSDPDSNPPPGRKRGPDHSTAGALHAARVLPPSHAATKLLQFVIAGHHGGLANREDLHDRLTKPEKSDLYDLAVRAADTDLLAPSAPPAMPPFLAAARGPALQRDFEFLTRMIFSALVDADFLDTESFMDAVGARVPQRRHWPELSQYREPLDAELRRLATTTTGSVTVRRARADVLRWCRDAATQTRGTFSLTVPTGGGKTLASLAFALDHALAHGLARIIVVLPFLSIIDQTAEVFRRIFGPSFGDRVLIEHHSSVRPEHDTMCNRLAAENWDAPLIVTTQVQFFESLFARRTTDCRKLHNIANSVVILDEVQTLPIGLLDPILDALQQLSTSYGTSLVLTTATQPSLHTRPLEPYPFAGLQPQPREIVPSAEIDRLFDRLRRVRVIWPQRGDGGAPAPLSWPELAARIAAHPQVLAIVHKRDDARALWREVTDRAPGALHLSALMCAAHRRAVLAEIGRRLDAAESCRVVSTQLVEAGVDVDFPVVYRAMAGLESLAQSAGRCNRNGALPSGDFHVFDAPTEPPRSLLAHRAIANVMLTNERDDGNDLDLFSPHVHRAYFDRLYAPKDRDAERVQQSRQQLDFEETASRFRMIPDETTPVFVPWGANGRRALDRFRESPPNRETLRHLQPYSVSVHEGDLRALQSRGAVELVHDMLWVLVLDSDYDETFGLDVKGEAFRGWMV